MSNQVIFYIMGGSVGLLLILGIAYYIISKKMQKSEYRKIKKLQQGTKEKAFSAEILYQKLYIMYVRIPFLKRYIERITECIPVESKNEYTFEHRNEKTLEGKFDKFFDNATHYFTKSTDKQLYKYRNILEYIDGEYVITNPITDENIKDMRNNMDETDAEAFDRFIERHWGNKQAVQVNAGIEEKPKRGRKPKTNV